MICIEMKVFLAFLQHQEKKKIQKFKNIFNHVNFKKQKQEFQTSPLI
jgi:hypothetical protein